MLPHPPLPQHYSSTEEKPAFVNGLFDAGAAHYDAIVDWDSCGAALPTGVGRCNDMA